MSATRKRRRSTARRGGAWPLWVRLLVVVAVVAAVVWVVLWLNGLQTWVKVAIAAGSLCLLAIWWLVTRRHDIVAEMDRRARAEKAAEAERRRRP